MRADKIRGFLPEKEYRGLEADGNPSLYEFTRHELIDTIGQKELELDIQKLSQAIREIALDHNALWEEMDKVDNLGVDMIATAISSRISEVLVVKSGCPHCGSMAKGGHTCRGKKEEK